MSPRILIAGVGNIFFGDDAFGVETARRLAGMPLPPGVTVVDFGIRSVHFAYELLEPPDLLIILDAISQGDAPGTVYLLEPNLEGELPSSLGDAHGMDLRAVFGMARSLGGGPKRVLIVGCEPAKVSGSMELSAPVRSAVGSAANLVRDILRRELCATLA